MKSIVQIELTNHCNRRCVYCGVPTMVRPKGFAEWKLIERCVEVMKEIGQTKDFGLHHFGESTMHPKLIEFIKYFNDNGMTPFLNTNGDFLTDELIAKLATVKLNPLIISGHIEYEKRVVLWQKCTDAGIPTWYHLDMLDAPTLTNLGGQIELNNKESDVLKLPILTDPMTQCGFLRKEMGIVLWNGDLTVCCFDYEGHGKFGSIYDPNVAELKPQIFSTCATCPGHPGQP
jgi:hypothetical protein